MLCIVFLPVHTLLIDGIKFRLVWDPPSLGLPDETTLPLIKDPVAVPGTSVRVRLLRSSIPGAMTLGFEAPSDVVIWREPVGEVL